MYRSAAQFNTNVRPGSSSQLTSFLCHVPLFNDAFLWGSCKTLLKLVMRIYLALTFGHSGVVKTTSILHPIFRCFFAKNSYTIHHWQSHPKQRTFWHIIHVLQPNHTLGIKRLVKLLRHNVHGRVQKPTAYLQIYVTLDLQAKATVTFSERDDEIFIILSIFSERQAVYFITTPEFDYKLEALGQCIPPPRHVSRGCLSWACDVMTS